MAQAPAIVNRRMTDIDSVGAQFISLGAAPLVALLHCTAQVALVAMKLEGIAVPFGTQQQERDRIGPLSRDHPSPAAIRATTSVCWGC